MTDDSGSGENVFQWYLRWLHEQGLTELGQADLGRVEAELVPVEAEYGRLPGSIRDWFLLDLVGRHILCLPWFDGNAQAARISPVGAAAIYDGPGMFVEGWQQARDQGRLPIAPLEIHTCNGDSLLFECAGPRVGWVYHYEWFEIGASRPVARSMQEYLTGIVKLREVGLLDHELMFEDNTGRWPPDDTPGAYLGYSVYPTSRGRSQVSPDNVAGLEWRLMFDESVSFADLVGFTPPEPDDPA